MALTDKPCCEQSLSLVPHSKNCEQLAANWQPFEESRLYENQSDKQKLGYWCKKQNKIETMKQEQESKKGVIQRRRKSSLKLKT